MKVDMFAYNYVMQVLTITDSVGKVHRFTKFMPDRFHKFLHSECKHKAFNAICEDYPKLPVGSVGFIS